jgi:hypothetical protein
MKAQIIKAPGYPAEEHEVSIFLAGSIEMGKAEDWQYRVTQSIQDYPVTIYNPRREEWDSSWEQRESNPQFRGQVNWEANRLEQSLVIFFYFQPGTQSPISLLEFGKYINSEKHILIVCCPDGFWRKGNLEIECSRANTPIYHTLEAAIASLDSVLSVTLY